MTTTAVGAGRVRVHEDAAYWNTVAREWAARGHVGAWRGVSDAVNRRLIDRWLPAVPGGTVLKTDLFDELVGEGLAAPLAQRFATVAGIDLSPTLVELVAERHPEIDARAADVRDLPFAAEAFDAVLSDSTLDHFETVDEIAAALHELHRVLRPGGSLLITLDNGMNPAVAVRNALPAQLRNATGLVPYAVGATCRTPTELRGLLEAAGFEVARLGAVLHCPRVLGVLAGRAVDRRGGLVARRRYTSALVACERLARLPSRYLTGHFLAALATRR